MTADKAVIEAWSLGPKKKFMRNAMVFIEPPFTLMKMM
jgi:hypothetical protein